jgi:predicted RNA-binding Zn-ribbon protein involved in translation (DUF1610 family)
MEIPSDSLPDLVLDSLVPKLMELMPNSEMELATVSLEEVAPESKELTAVSEELLALGSETTVLDSLLLGAFLCPGCYLVHEDRESWNREHSRLYPCSHCGLVHLDYWMRSTLRLDKFDCAATLAMKHEMEEADEHTEWRKINSK